MSERPACTPPPRLVAVCLFLWSLAFVGIGLPYHLDGESWPWVAYALAAGLVAIGARGLRRGQWREPLLGALYLLASACVIGGSISGQELFAAVGILSLVLLSATLVLAHPLLELAAAARERRPD